MKQFLLATLLCAAANCAFAVDTDGDGLSEGAIGRPHCLTLIEVAIIYGVSQNPLILCWAEQC